MNQFSVSRISCISFMFLFILFLQSNASSAEVAKGGPMADRYQNWLKKHGKVYDNRDEWQMRFGIYQSHVELIEFINSQNLSFRLNDNAFADMTNHEFKSTYLGLKGQEGSRRAENFLLGSMNDPPEAVDWRSNGAVTPIKNQGSCGMQCFLFTAFLLVTLFLHSKSYSQTCLLQEAAGHSRQLQQSKASTRSKLETWCPNETDYPYAGQNGQCATAKEKNYAASINGYETVPIKNETALKVAVSMQPVSVAIDAGGLLFQLYDGGIFSGFCGTRLNHGVAAVGYGEEEGRKYWIVKNSWGTEWGEDGYIRMERGIIDKTGKCGIALEPSYPVKNA